MADTNDALDFEKLSWWNGHWVGTGLGGDCEMTWDPPAGGTITGLFKFMKEGKPVFYEFILLSNDENGTSLKLKHFNPDLSGWEEKEDFIAFEFVSADETSISFEGLSYHKISDCEMEARLKIKSKEGSIREETFSYRKAGIK